MPNVVDLVLADCSVVRVSVDLVYELDLLEDSGFL
jgi:hypothetical protein